MTTAVALFDRFLSTAAMGEVFDTPALVQGMLDFEAALARAQAAEGVIPAEAAGAIAAQCRHERFDLDALVVAGCDVRHLIAPGVVEQHALSPEVRVDGARLVYDAPGGQTSLGLGAG